MWANCVYQKFIDLVGIETIAANVDEQYIKPLHEKYMGYNKSMILQILAQLRTGFVISNTEKLKMEAYFDAPWSNTPNAHVMIFATHIDKRHLECADFEIIISGVGKTIFFVEQMDLSGLFENEYLENYNKTADKLWKTTVDAFTNQYNKEICRTKKRGNHK